MTMDFRQIRGTIHEALQGCREWEKAHYDFPWGYSIDKLTKEELRVQWGYLKHMGEGPIVVTVEDNAAEGEEPALCAIATLPCGERRVVLIGERDWDDCKTIPEGVKLAIFLAARRAMYMY